MTRPTTLGIVARYPYGFFFNSVLFGAQAIVRQHNANLLVVQGSPGSVAASRLAHNQVDAWMILSHIDGAEQLVAQAKPTVTVGAVLPGLACPAVVPDNRGGIETAMDHLFDHGHERIAFVGWTAIGDINERYAGYQAALAKRGIPLDPNRIVITTSPLADEGQRAAQQLIANGLPCTAIVVGTDLNAIGVMEGLHDAGYRIPEDIAVIGFDDIPQAQSTTPPLSTIRQSFDALGAQAARMLLESLNGHAPDTSIVHTPVMFVQRRSCGCSTSIEADEIQTDDRYRGPEWREQLARALVDVLLHPIASDPNAPPTRIWPEVTTLVTILSDTLDGAAQPDFSDLQSVWSSDFALRANVESLHAALKLVEHVATLRAEAGSPEQRERLAGLLDRMRLEVLRSYRRDQEGRIRYLERVVSNTHRISLLLLDENNPAAQQLSWLGSTEIVWGCLALRNDPRDGRQPELVVEQSYSQV
jgi:DNA-binding LacI/PurR family transcriptional regulator